jgi:hypothetical protein
VCEGVPAHLLEVPVGAPESAETEEEDDAEEVDRLQ